MKEYKFPTGGDLIDKLHLNSNINNSLVDPQKFVEFMEGANSFFKKEESLNSL